jgi:hypothetical protein
MSEHFIELFVLKCAPIHAALEAALSAHDPEIIRAKASLQDDPMLRRHLSQIALYDRLHAERMAEYYKVFYAFENYIRDFVTSVLEDEEGEEDWWENRVPESIRRSAQSARQRELDTGVTPRSDAMLTYTSFGDLGEIIKANLDRFGGLFASTRGLEATMARLNTLRGPIMHCGVLAEDEVVRLKTSVGDWFRLFETAPNTSGN